MEVSGKLVDVHERRIYPARITFDNGRISGICETIECSDQYIMPGLIDSHVHIESSMLTPGEFARKAVSHGTVGVVSDPHEIANVLGIQGVNYMVDEGRKVPFYFWFGAPSCVPATELESSGAVISAEDVGLLLQRPEIKYLSEMMNFPGVISEERSVRLKIEAAKRYGKPVDGHAPGLGADALRKYVSAGISTDHECSNITEAIEKISLGMKILIREGSAARNLDALKELYKHSPEMLMLCSDDIHPEMLSERHINKLVSKLVNENYDIFDVLRSCTVNPVMHYGLESGLLTAGQPADFIVVDDPSGMNVMETWIKGERVSYMGKAAFSYNGGHSINRFNCTEITEDDIKIPRKAGMMRVILAYDGELLTGSLKENAGRSEYVDADPDRDILKIVVKERYSDAPPATGFIKGFGLKRGAFAGSVAHDSHNIISIGTCDADIASAINEIIRLKGGLSFADRGMVKSMQLEIAGIMSSRPCNEVASDYQALSEMVKSAGSNLSAPYMTLSFMALLVIPELKISDRGLFDGRDFSYVPLFTG